MKKENKEEKTYFTWIFKEIYSPLTWGKEKEYILFKEKNILVREMLTGSLIEPILFLQTWFLISIYTKRVLLFGLLS